MSTSDVTSPNSTNCNKTFRIVSTIAALVVLGLIVVYSFEKDVNMMPAKLIVSLLDLLGMETSVRNKIICFVLFVFLVFAIFLAVYKIKARPSVGHSTRTTRFRVMFACDFLRFDPNGNVDLSRGTNRV